MRWSPDASPRLQLTLGSLRLVQLIFDWTAHGSRRCASPTPLARVTGIGPQPHPGFIGVPGGAAARWGEGQVEGAGEDGE